MIVAISPAFGIFVEGRNGNPDVMFRLGYACYKLRVVVRRRMRSAANYGYFALGLVGRIAYRNFGNLF